MEQKVGCAILQRKQFLNPFIHILPAEEVSAFLESKQNTIVL